MLYRCDWERVQQRYAAWLAGQNDLPILQVYARKKVPQTHGHTWWDFVHDMAHPARAFEAFEKWCQQTHFGGDALPNLFVNLGPGNAAAYLGCPADIQPDTVWFQEPGTSWEQILAARLDETERWWRYTLDIYRMAGQYAKDKFLVAMTDLGAVMNVLASLRGTQQLLIDLIEQPQQVQQASQHIHRIWLECYDRIYTIARQYQHGMTDCMNIWGPGRYYDVQCDFSAMISPTMFEKFVVPHLQAACRRLDWSIYHWDGPGQIPHLDLLLDIPELTGIQWTPGAGRPGTGSPQWFDLYRRIQAAGKRLVLLGVSKADVQGIVETFDPRGLLIEARGCQTPEEADDLVRCVARWVRQ